MSNTALQTPSSRQALNAKRGSDNKLHIPYRTTVIALLTISAALIWINSEALLYWPAFYTVWIEFFPWVTQLGNLSFILGVILGLVIDMAVIAYSFGFRVEAAFIVFPTATISLIIGGGFIAGLIIAVLTGIFIMINEKASTIAEAQSAAR